MKNKGIVIFLIILAVVIISVVALDYNASKPENQPENPYALNVDAFSVVDTALIHYKEIRKYDLSFAEPAGVSWHDNQLYIVGDQKMQVIQITGKLIKEVSFDTKPTCIYVSAGNIYVGSRNSVTVLNHEGIKIDEWKQFSDSTVITSVAEHAGTIFVADAGKRIVRRFSREGKPLGTIEGKAGNDQIHGFVIPSPYFDLAFNQEGELWIVNPGRHALENYTTEGTLRTWWQASSIRVDGFSGCCNPAQFAFLPDGSFVTSEKGMVRIKTYKPSGEFSGVVAAPSKFTAEGEAPDLATDDQGNIYALDMDKKVLRLFVKK